ncbi:MAG: 16S rRNA (guanine(966)-N(2))-methyltransferase RsmD [Hyphomicrobiaceae bacterium]|nr:16S rRNA (guanine(966)-N(2))-methyltransferase RsmD [Hyphomicrobiaceae bacterium]
MRIVGGAFKGTALSAPKSMAIRPTTDRLRESVFNILAHGLGDPVSEARVLDLFAGTGALGLEALSRGARYCIFVEEAAEARGLIRANVEVTRQTGTTKIWRRDATRMGPCSPMEPFDLVFADPPYGKGLGEQALASALAGGWLKPGATVVWEEAADAAVTIPDGFELVDEREQGESRVRFLVVGGQD